MDYKKYARLLIEAEKSKGKEDFEEFFVNFIKTLEKKNKINLLPKILKEIENIFKRNEALNKTKLILKDENDFDRIKKEIEKYSKEFNLDNLKIEKNKKIVGGYILKNKKHKLDNSYKKKLISMYNKIVG